MGLCILALLLSLLPLAAFAQEADAPGPEDGLSSFPQFESLFLDEEQEPILTETSYLSHNVLVEISTDRFCDSDIYIADIYVRDLSLFRRGYPTGKWGVKTQKITTLSQELGAIVSITGDYAKNLEVGLVYGNGVRYRKSVNNKRQVGVIYKTGEMEILPGKDLHYYDLEKDERGIWETFLFGPSLLDGEGHAMTQFSSDVKPANPRSVVGYFEPGHYCLVQVDGRGVKSKLESGARSKGLTLAQLSEYMESLGCAAAYNLDGGASCMMWFNGEIISTPYEGGRSTWDVLYVPML